MSHIPNVFSPAGTPLLERTVGELVAERPSRSRVFENLKIDFCCQGGRTLREACERAQLPAATVVEQLEAELAAPTSIPSINPTEIPLHDLAAYIVHTHHEYLRRELPRLHEMAAKVVRVHGANHPSLLELFKVFAGLEAELTSHLLKEEQILFPEVIALSLGEARPQWLGGPISQMIHEHDDAGVALARLRELSNEFVPPEDACNTYRALFAGLAELEADLHRHIHLENSVLFPGAQALAEKP